MHATCLHCTKSLGANEVLETLPIGRRIAFDAAQGRLWVVCPHCAKWNLVPFDTRLETIDAAERLFRDTRTRYSTDNIGLAKVREGLELVRIGSALRPEFAAWRYGEQYRRRRRRAMALGATGVVAAGVVIGVATTGPLMAVVGAGTAGLGTQLLTTGWRAAMRLQARIRVIDPGNQGRALTLGLGALEQSALVMDDAMRLEVPRAVVAAKEQRVTWEGTDVCAVGRRAVGSLNLLSGTHRQLENATTLLAEHEGNMEPWLRKETDRRRDWRHRMSGPLSKAERSAAFDFQWGKSPRILLGHLPGGDRLAVEMWMNEDIERTWLEGELKLLEREWQEAERLATIADALAFEAAGVGEECR